jgi:hypothetical protein
VIFTLSQVEADESLPHFMLDPRLPDWIRCDRYRHVSELEHCMALFAVRHGNSQAWFDRNIAQRASRGRRRAKREADEAALPAEVREANARRKAQAKRLTFYKSKVSLWRNQITAAEERADMLSMMELPSLRAQMARAQRDLAAYVDAALQSEFESQSRTDPRNHNDHT